MENTLRKYIRGQILKEGLRFNELNGCSLLIHEKKHYITFLLVDGNFGMTLKTHAENYDWNSHDPRKSIDRFIRYSPAREELLSNIYGMVYVWPDSENPYGAWEVKKAAAKDGWGPTLYDIVMGLSPNGIMGDRESVSKSAFNVYQFYLDNRDDIEKKPIDLSGWTETTEDDGVPGSNGEWLPIYENWRLRSLNMDQTLEDPLTWVYNRERVPQTDQLIENGIKKVRNYVVPWPMEDDSQFKYFFHELADIFFMMRY